MKFYKLKALSVGAKGNRVLYKEDNETYPENTWHEGTAEKLVESKHLIRLKEDPIKVELKIEIEPEKDKPEDKKEPSILDSMKEAGGEETEETEETEKISEEDERKSLLKDAKKLAKEKEIKAPHYLTGIEKLKTFINDNK